MLEDKIVADKKTLEADTIKILWPIGKETPLYQPFTPHDFIKTMNQYLYNSLSEESIIFDPVNEISSFEAVVTLSDDSTVNVKIELAPYCPKCRDIGFIIETGKINESPCPICNTSPGMKAIYPFNREELSMHKRT